MFRMQPSMFLSLLRSRSPFLRSKACCFLPFSSFCSEVVSGLQQSGTQLYIRCRIQNWSNDFNILQHFFQGFFRVASICQKAHVKYGKFASVDYMCYIIVLWQATNTHKKAVSVIGGRVLWIFRFLGYIIRHPVRARSAFLLFFPLFLRFQTEKLEEFE